MPIVSPTTPSSTNAVTPTSLQTTSNDKAFYIYSGLIDVTSTETTMFSVNDIGRRDILFCLEAGCSSTLSSNNPTIKIKVNDQIIFQNTANQVHAESGIDIGEIKLIIPANTSLEVTLTINTGTHDFTVAGYGYYLQ
jgi:hypothetical protein